jgi:hypothetical protein
MKDNVFGGSTSARPHFLASNSPAADDVLV